jgi:DNA-binding PadR family transcriptional regulator
MTLGWRPSPGSVYPLLEALSTEGLIRQREDGRYETTAKGRESVVGPWELFSHHATTVEGIVEEMRANVSYLEDLAAGKSTKLTPQLKALHTLGERLTKLAAS